MKGASNRTRQLEKRHSDGADGQRQSHGRPGSWPWSCQKLPCGGRAGPCEVSVFLSVYRRADQVCHCPDFVPDIHSAPRCCCPPPGRVPSLARSCSAPWVNRLTSLSQGWRTPQTLFERKMRALLSDRDARHWSSSPSHSCFQPYSGPASHQGLCQAATG